VSFTLSQLLARDLHPDRSECPNVLSVFHSANSLHRVEYIVVFAGALVLSVFHWSQLLAPPREANLNVNHKC
jgi:hypothetical protein